ncbi:hypothetical protein CLHUN_38720 [Ruminiclostridium hungatei]|uniref:Uncharacterized protein n=1 Tax=Ruminiclostridium hungatei TaxID=48256 RepID=A0A1V4SE74_RUMHU|nr:DUF1574 family protein [Ruminiclostridium hungatei]OPX42222.1 hypothetical protein CLHUN_38720 [Ruminiclostridium hungatei]
MRAKLPLRASFILKIIVFLIIFKIIDMSVGGALYYYKYFDKPDMHELMWRDFYSHENNSIDVMFLGSSHARFAFDSGYFDRELNTKTFNLSSSGQTPLVGYYALKEALKYQKPKVLVYEVYWRMLGATDNVTPAYFVFDYIKGCATKVEMLAALSGEKTFSSFFMETAIKTYKNRDGLIPAVKKVLNGELINSDVEVGNNIEYTDFTYYKNGYFGSEKIATPYKLSVANPFKKAGLNFKWNQRQLEYMKKTLILCKENNVKVIMVAAPVPRPTMDFLKDYDEAYGHIKSIADSFKIDFMDYNLINRQTGMFTNDMFYDSNHLNVKGTGVLDRHFAPVIKKYLY